MTGMTTSNIPEMPDILPVFPLSGVLLLPGGELPLNIFEPRYLEMFDAALRGDRLIGMIQPEEGKEDTAFGPPLCRAGCAGRITAFQETEDGRYLITLTGVQRFSVEEELNLEAGYRRVRPDWSEYSHDLQRQKCLDVDRERLKSLLKDYFHKTGLSCEWELLDEAPDRHLMTALAMICPFSAKEKQALLEARNCQDRTELFINLLNMAINDSSLAQGSSFH